MEWVELLVGLVGGGLGGIIIGRVWDNRREDRFRFIYHKREAAVEYLDAIHQNYNKRLEWHEATHLMLERAEAWKTEPDYVPGMGLSGKDTHLYTTSEALRNDVAALDTTLSIREASIFMLFSSAEVIMKGAILSSHVRHLPRDPSELPAHSTAMETALGGFTGAVRTDLGIAQPVLKAGAFDAAFDEFWDSWHLGDNPPATKGSSG